MRGLFFLTVLMLGLSSTAKCRADNQPADPPAAEVSVTLALVELKPNKAQAFRCTVKNGTAKAISVAESYDNASSFLVGKGEGQRFELRLYMRPAKKLGRVEIKPGDERVAYELPIQDVLFDVTRDPVPDGKRAWNWDWQARPMSPLTPFHESSRTNRLLSRAEFWAEIEVDGKKFGSKRISLVLRLEVAPAPMEK